MSVVAVPTKHFDGNKSVSMAPTTGADLRSLRGILNEIITQSNTNESGVASNLAAIGLLGTPLQLKGSISLAADFPTVAAVADGHTYIIAADVTDSDGTKTNTGQSFKEGDEITWNGTDWTRLGRNVTQLTKDDYQNAAATATTKSFMALRAGKINAAAMKAEVTAAAGEDMAIDIQINSVSCLTSAVTLDNAAGTTVQDATIDTAANTIAKGDIIEVVRTYTAGGTPTPMTDTHVAIGYEETLT